MMIKHFLSFWLCLTLALSSAHTQACAEEAAGRAEAMLEGILTYHLQRTGASGVQAWIDGELTATAGMGAEWNVFGLSRMTDADFSGYAAALTGYMAEAGALGAVTLQKHVLVLLCTGGADAQILKKAVDAAGTQGIMTWVYGLHLLNNGAEGSVSAQQAVEALLGLQLADGGWALRGETADVDVTSMVLQALAPHANEEKTAQSAERAVELLSRRQLETGDFVSYGAPNPESASQVVIALSALGINAFEDERFIKNGATLLDVLERYRLEDGSFCHLSGGAFNPNATAQTMHALIAWQRMMDGRGALYLPGMPETDETQMKTSPGYRLIASAVIAGLALIACVILLAMGKRSLKNYLAVLAAGCALIAFVLTTDFQTADGYYTGQTPVKRDPIGRVTMSIRCDKALGKTDVSLPADGVLLAETEFAIVQGDTVYSILTEAARAYGIRLDTSGPQGMIYVSGINHLYEFACGELSGWTYLLNGETADIGCDQHALADGDRIEWHYTCELGNDLK